MHLLQKARFSRRYFSAKYIFVSTSAIYHCQVSKAAELARNDKTLRDSYQFGWLDGNEIANSIILGTMEIPGIVYLNFLCSGPSESAT